MAKKGIWRSAGPDDPIYKGGFVISSKNSNRGSTKSTKTSQAEKGGQSTEKSTPDDQS